MRTNETPALYLHKGNTISGKMERLYDEARAGHRNVIISKPTVKENKNTFYSNVNTHSLIVLLYEFDVHLLLILRLHCFWIQFHSIFLVECQYIFTCSHGIFLNDS